MKQAQKNLINILKSAIFSKKEYIDECDFEKVEALAVSHCCVSLAYQGAVLCNLNPPAEWKNASMLTAINNYRNLEVQKKVINILKKNNIPCVIMKGITAAVKYAYPMSRGLGDIDILVRDKDYRNAVSVFEQEVDDREKKFHTSFLYEGVSVEIHKAIDDYVTSTNGGKIERIMKNALDEVEYTEFDGYKIPALKTEYMAVMFLNHMYRHFLDNEITMRMFCDWAVFAVNSDKNDWKSVVYPVLKETGLNKFADALNLCVQKYMDVDLSPKILSNIDSLVIDQLMEEFVYDGTKTSEDFLAGNIAKSYNENNSKDKGFFVGTIDVLNGIARRDCYVAKYKIMLPLCWIYIAIRYGIRLMFGKRKLVSYKKISETVNRRDNIKKTLGLG